VVNPSPNDTGLTAADFEDPELNQARDQAIAQSQAALSEAGNNAAAQLAQGNIPGANHWTAQGYYALASYYQGLTIQVWRLTIRNWVNKYAAAIVVVHRLLETDTPVSSHMVYLEIPVDIGKTRHE